MEATLGNREKDLPPLPDTREPPRTRSESSMKNHELVTTRQYVLQTKLMADRLDSNSGAQPLPDSKSKLDENYEKLRD